MSEDLIFKPLDKNDLKFISEVYNFFILNSTSTYHVKPLFEKDMSDYFMLNSDLVDGFIIVLNENKIGFCLLKPYNKKKEGYNFTYEITIYIKKNYQSKGIGKQAVMYLENLAKKRKIHIIIAGICTENDASIKLFERCGYQKCGFFKEVGYKFNRWLDNVYYQKVLDNQN